MKLIAPDYYPSFRCIAGACRHTCCVGWEIDIDEDTMEIYRHVPGELGRRLQEGIVENEEGAHFALRDDERCPFLNHSGLCDLIIGLGEESLCQVCSDHPRFRSFLSDRTEIGLGLCCEAAARLILLRQEPMKLIELQDDGEPEVLWDEDAEVLAARDRMIAIMQDRSKPVAEREQMLCEAFAVRLPERSMTDWAQIYMGLERLDPEWTDRLTDLLTPHGGVLLEGEAWELALEQLMVYLIYRHVTVAAEDGDLAGRAAFAVLSWRMICALSEASGADVLEMTELARIYSSEIEYSDENIAALITECQKPE